ncbi:unnamed protein product [Urochloa humidicola]
MWSLWSSRNDRKHGKKVIPVQNAINWAMDMVMQLAPADSHKSEVGYRQMQKWTPPPLRSLKVNTDAAFSSGDLTGGTGAIIRDEEGRFRAARARHLGAVGSTLIAEAEACRDGVQLARDIGAQEVILETDSSSVVNLWNSRTTCRSEIAPILRDIEASSLAFSSFTMSFVRREANLAAHVCAKEASPVYVHSMWVDVAPDFLYRIVQEECNPLCV